VDTAAGESSSSRASPHFSLIFLYIIIAKEKGEGGMRKNMWLACTHLIDVFLFSQKKKRKGGEEE